MRQEGRTQFLIVGTYRSGSSAVVEAVNSHPRILCGYEWTLRIPAWRKVRVAQAALNGDFSDLIARHRDVASAGLTPGIRVLGFKQLFRSSDKWVLHPRCAAALVVDRLGAHLRWLAANPRIRIVHIVRQDNVAWLRSKVLADASRQYSGGRYPDGLRLSVGIAEAKRRVRAKLWIDQRLTVLSTSNPYCRVKFEDFAADNPGVTRNLVRFLGVDPGELPSNGLRHQSQSVESRAALENAEEVRRALGNLAWIPSV